jgi:hypothetical protein
MLSLGCVKSEQNGHTGKRKCPTITEGKIENHDRSVLYGSIAILSLFHIDRSITTA